MRKKYLPPSKEDKEFNEKMKGKYVSRRYLTGRTFTDKDGNQVEEVGLEIVKADKQ